MFNLSKTNRIKIEIGIALCIVIALSIALFTIGAEGIVSSIGVENTYLVMFLIALFGGMTSIGGATYTTSIITFASGGSDPVFIALLAGFGTGIGDTAYFTISRRSSTAFADSDNYFMKKINAFSQWLKDKSSIAKFTGVYVYTALGPLPNDPVTISLGLSRASKKVIIPALFLGNTTFAFLLAYLGDALPFI